MGVTNVVVGLSFLTHRLFLFLINDTATRLMIFFTPKSILTTQRIIMIAVDVYACCVLTDGALATTPLPRVHKQRFLVVVVVHRRFLRVLPAGYHFFTCIDTSQFDSRLGLVCYHYRPICMLTILNVLLRLVNH